MRKSNKKGFTIVELVIVIAVIAILAAVLIPTFSTVVDKANKSAAKQNANGIYKEYLVDKAEEAEEIDYVLVDGTYYDVNDGFEPEASAPTSGKFVEKKVSNETVTWEVETLADSE